MILYISDILRLRLFVQNLIVIFISCKKRKKIVKTTTKYVLSGVAAVVVALAVAPFVMAESGYTHSYHDDTKSHDGEKKHGNMIEMFNAYCNMSPEEQAEVIAKHNKSDEMVSKINEYCSLDEEGRKAMMAEYKEKSFDHSSMDGAKWSHHSMKNKYADLTPEEREAKMAQHSEMKEAFSALSEVDQETIMNYFKEMKSEYTELSEEERTAKHDEMKTMMEEFMPLSLDEKIVYLTEFAESLRSN